ncbi:hypothetical protein DL766_000907 [Monosporascus sp. MC13-8B]|uniref:DUF6606 domain-containing protein n=1 Tax=Monosporascus cannonballus TaxID=155416 RepID=A0ABY0HAZ5_9PEZI|nr:hypothetical protein DL762_003293 [Monosporascus cannonballus]RYP00763.1 hypothetical protein DL763_000643 [Monosporascus cannonballus]RYP38490.1 hypothetical protein DL766_000907 [Monosporascus sp. MC13-8B]
MPEHFGQLDRNNMLILYVVEQIAALLVRHDTCNGQQYIVFKEFKTSTTSEQVLTADHALKWDFPGHSAQASMEALYNLQASTREANVPVTETRDTTDPALVTQMLMPILEAIGSRNHAPVLRKRVRHEVNTQGEVLPWRRLPFWLVLRVAAQRQLSLALGNELGRIGYKFLMCVLLGQLIQESAGKLNPELTMMLRAKLLRRMAKLEMDKANIRPSNAAISEPLFIRLGPMIKATVEEVTTQFEATWESSKQAAIWHIPKLSSGAPDYALL